VRTLYNILYMVFFVLSSPYYFWRLRRRPADWTTGFGQRFASYDPSIKQALTNRQILWIHAVSVGEVGLCTQLISALEPRLPNAKLVVSCTTSTGMEEYRKRLPSRITKIYYPLDRRKYVRHALATINPEAVVLLEAEIWPNFLWRAGDLNIPVFLVNARLSERSHPRYKKFARLFRPLFASFAGVSCQNEEDAKRMCDAGCRPAKVQVVGNLKFDAARLTEKRSLDVRGLLRQIGVADDALILVGGSTHDGEEFLLADVAARLRKKFPNLFLILAPRHNERCPDLARKLNAQGVKLVLRNAIYANTQMRAGEADCLLVNTIGELKFFYAQASVVFVGKSLTAIGGQNPIEPAALGKPVLFGPNMQNFKDIVRIFLSRNAAVQVNSLEALESELAALLENQNRRTELGQRAQEAVAENLGSVERTVEMILPELARRGMYIVPKNKAMANVVI
jgi:3-deoxy-D-manno-octulosonic-acid transferase